MSTFRSLLCVLLCTSFLITTAFIPPHPDLWNDETFRKEHEEWQRQQQEEERRSLLPFSNNGLRNKNRKDPKLLHPMACRYLTDSECLQADDIMTRQASNVRSMVQATGQLRALVLMLQFSDHVDRDLPSRQDLNTLLNGREADATIAPTGSVSEWLRINSYDKMNIQMDLTPDWITTDNTEEHYSFDKSGLSADFPKSWEPLLEQLDANGINWDDYDQDGDGYIDSLIILHSGYPAENGGDDCISGNDKDRRIWSHAISWIRAEPWTSSDGRITVGTYMVTSALRGRCGSNVARIGVMTHELIHTWGIPDLYDNNGWIGKGSGNFDIMSNPYGKTHDSLNPPFAGPWTKMQLGWLNPTLLDTDGQYSVSLSEITEEVYYVDLGFPDGEYLLIENRQPIMWDKELWDGGIVIWHIDEKAKLQKNRGFFGQHGWPGNGNHYQIAVVQAQDFHLEIGTNSGDSQDYFVSGKELGPGPGVKNATNPGLYPNTDSYQGGNIAKTGLRFYDFSPSQDIMTFKVGGAIPLEPTLAPSESPTLSPTPSPTEQPSSSPTATPSLFPTSAPSQSPAPTTPMVEVAGYSGKAGAKIGLPTFFLTMLVLALFTWKKYARSKPPPKRKYLEPKAVEPQDGMHPTEQGFDIVDPSCSTFGASSSESDDTTSAADDNSSAPPESNISEPAEDKTIPDGSDKDDPVALSTPSASSKHEDGSALLQVFSGIDALFTGFATWSAPSNTTSSVPADDKTIPSGLDQATTMALATPSSAPPNTASSEPTDKTISSGSDSEPADKTVPSGSDQDTTIALTTSSSPLNRTNSKDEESVNQNTSIGLDAFFKQQSASSIPINNASSSDDDSVGQNVLSSLGALFRTDSERLDASSNINNSKDEGSAVQQVFIGIDSMFGMSGNLTVTTPEKTSPDGDPTVTATANDVSFDEKFGQQFPPVSSILDVPGKADVEQPADTCTDNDDSMIDNDDLPTQQQILLEPKTQVNTSQEDDNTVPDDAASSPNNGDTK